MPDSQLGDVPAFRHGPRITGFISESVKLTQTSDSPRTFCYGAGHRNGPHQLVALKRKFSF